MGKGELISANKVEGVYDPNLEQLTLFAEGEEQPATINIHFERVTWLGAVKFDLVGDVYPIGRPKKEYLPVKNVFEPIIIKSRATPSGTVIVATAENPQGAPIEVKWLGLIPPTPVSETNSSKAQKQSQIVLPPDLKIFTLIGFPFQIKEKVQSQPTGSIDVKFDDNYLKLLNASNEYGDIIWSLDGIRLGTTQVVITTTLPAPEILTLQKTYNVTIGVLEETKNTVTLEPNDYGNKDDDNVVISPSFKDRVRFIIEKVKLEYTDAALISVEATPYVIGNAVASGSLLTKLRAVFRTEDSTLTTVSLKGYHWTPVVKTAGIIVGVANIDFGDVKVGLEEAAEKVQEVFGKPYLKADLSEPLADQVQHPQYDFVLKDGYAYVDATTGEVWSGVVGVGATIKPSPDA